MTRPRGRCLALWIHVLAYKSFSTLPPPREPTPAACHPSASCQPRGNRPRQPATPQQPANPEGTDPGGLPPLSILTTPREPTPAACHTSASCQPRGNQLQEVSLQANLSKEDPDLSKTIPKSQKRRPASMASIPTLSNKNPGSQK